MKKFVIFAVLALFLAVVAVAEARSRDGDPPPPPPPPPDDGGFGDLPIRDFKWSQMPEMEFEWGYDVESNHDLTNNEPNIVVMDDFMCWDGNPITDVHWWGSYFNQYGPDYNPITSFHVSFHSDIPGESRPGGLLAAWDIDIADCNEVPDGVDYYGNAVYQYYVDLPEVFSQERDTIYWLDIKAILEDVEGNDNDVWGWHTAERLPPEPSWGDDAVWILDYNQDNGEYFTWGPVEYQIPGGELISLDMAFELTTIPEPMTLMMIGGALAGLAAFARRKK